MTIPSVCLITICINEMEWLPKLYAQHRGWPGLKRWSFVESSDEVYAAVNPKMVADGLSTDGTTEHLQQLASRDPLVSYAPMGVSSHPNKSLGKIAMKQLALQLVERERPDYVIAIDADEFYTYDAQMSVIKHMNRCPHSNAFIFPRTEIWRPPLDDAPLFSREVIGGFWGIPCSHWWRWNKGMRFDKCHNTPYDHRGRPFNSKLKDYRGEKDVPHMVHMGYASMPDTRLAKNSYYAERGEKLDKGRLWYVNSRDAWNEWRPGDELPNGATVVPYTGPIPECFK